MKSHHLIEHPEIEAYYIPSRKVSIKSNIPLSKHIIQHPNYKAKFKYHPTSLDAWNINDL